ncbi:MAG: ATP-binding protein [Candidatus Omnitrophota bacterium]
MNIFFILSLLIAITSLGLSFFLLSKTWQKPVNRVFGLFAISIGVWGLGGSVISIIPKANYQLAQFWWQIAYTGIILIPVLYARFIFEFLDLKRKFFIRTMYLIGLIFLLLNWFDGSRFFLGDLKFMFGQFYWHDWIESKSISYIIFYLSFYWCLLSYPFLLLLLNFKKTTGLRREQTKYIIFGSIFGWLGGESNFLPDFGINIYPFLNLLTPFYTLIVAYAILKHRLMDIDIVIKRTTVYSILVSLITILYFTIIYITELLFRRFVGYKSIPMALGFISLFTLIFQPLKNFIQSFIDKYFFKGSQATLAEELQKAQEELKRAERLKAVGTLAAGMAHEIKNPLTGIMTFTEYLPTKYTDPAFIEKFHKIVSTEVNKINSIVEQLLDFSKPKPLKLQEANIHNIIDQTLSLLNNDIIKYKINVSRNYDNTFPMLHIDPNQIQQVFCNFFLNAIDALKEGGELTIATQQLPDNAEITISDTGQGIPKKDLEHIFDPFYTTKETGTGLGMSIIYGIIKEHKGIIGVESEVNKGTTFTIKLPYCINF